MEEIDEKQLGDKDYPGHTGERRPNTILSDQREETSKRHSLDEVTNIDERIWSEINAYPTATERLFRSREQTLIGDDGYLERVINEEFTKQLDVGPEFVQSSASGSAFPFNTGPESNRSTSNSSAIPLNQELNEMLVKNRANDQLYKLAQDADRYAQSYNSLLSMAELLAEELFGMTALLKTYGSPRVQDHSREERLADAVLQIHERLMSQSDNRFHKIMDLVDKNSKTNATRSAQATKSAPETKAGKLSRLNIINPIVNLIRYEDPIPQAETPKFKQKLHISDRFKQYSKRKGSVDEPAKTDDMSQPSQPALPSPSRSLRSTPARNATANKGVLNQIKTSPVSKKRRSGSKSKRERSKDDWHSIITTDGRENGRYLILKINAYHK